ncbi:MAG: hypothetical protein [Bacteriophage sp.]|nr:MAG: hypothetical protein [Bacteriophage sp.]
MPTFGEYYRDLGYSLEGLVIDGSLQREVEHTFYAEVKDLAEIKKKAIRVERHEQWKIPVEQDRVDGKMRIRLIDNQRATMCTKITYPSMVGCDEVEQDITMDMFNSLRKMAEDGYIKTRYTIPTNVPKLYWEVDVFLGNGGMEHPWVKIDLEVKSLSDPIPAFPFDLSEVIYPDEDLGWSSKNKIKSLWEKEWQKMDVTVPVA